MDTKRILALDVGERRIGVAVSDPLGLTAQSVDTIHRVSVERDLAAIAGFLTQYDTDRLLLGLPSNMNGEEGMQAEYTRRFAEKLKERGWQVRFCDERMTTALARNVLIESGMRREKRKQYIDRIAATYILQTYLDAGGWKDEPYKFTGNEVFHTMNDIENYDGSMDTEDIIELVDEEGHNVKFEFIDKVEHKGEKYVVLAPAEDMQGIEEDEVVIMHYITDDENEENDRLEPVIDDKLLTILFNKYIEQAEAEEDEDE